MGRGLFRGILESGSEGAIGVVLLLMAVGLAIFYFVLILLAWAVTLALLCGMFLTLWVIWEEPTRWPHQSPLKVRVLGYLLVVAIAVIIYTVVPTTFWLGLWDFMTFGIFKTPDTVMQLEHPQIFAQIF